MQTCLYLKILFIQVLPPWRTYIVTMEKKKTSNSNGLSNQHSRTETTLYLPTSRQTCSHLCFRLMGLTPPSFISPRYSLLPNPANFASTWLWQMHFLLYIWWPSCLIYHQLCCRQQPRPIMSALLPSIYSPLQLVNLPTAPFPPSDGFSLLWGSKAEQPMKPCVVHPQHLSSLSTY